MQHYTCPEGKNTWRIALIFSGYTWIYKRKYAIAKCAALFHETTKGELMNHKYF